MTEHSFSGSGGTPASGAGPNNMAMMTNSIRAQYAFDGTAAEDVDVFAGELDYYLSAFNFSPDQKKFSLRSTLRGEALAWFRSQPTDATYEDLMQNLVTRFSPPDKIITGIRQLAALRPEGTRYLMFCDNARSIATRCEIPVIVLIAFTIIALPEHVGTYITMARNGGPLTWELVYESCRRVEGNAKSQAPAAAFPSHLVASVDKAGTARNKLLCKYCGRTNHSTDYCFELAERNRQKPLDKKKSKTSGVAPRSSHDQIRSYSIEEVEENKTQDVYLCFHSSGAASTAVIAIGNRTLKCLLDSGSDVCLLRTDHASTLGLEIEKIGVRLRAAGGSILTVRGIVRDVPFSIDSEKCATNFIIVDNLGCDGLLGRDFLVKQGTTLTFGKHPPVVGSTRNTDIQIQHCIDTGDHKPVSARIYRQGPQFDSIISEEIAKLLKQKIIRPSFSPWASPVLLVPKKDSSWRMCIDYRSLNELTVKDAYPVPTVEEILGRPGKRAHSSQL
ncbi:hypothetical protein PAPHI01_2448 [Pancytospora philotis]|nr:hypothetical protein PAPHI01_2448 [Pancytospora philotis]